MYSKTSPTTAADFKRITGIGPAIEQHLHQAGVLTFAQLAALAPVDIADLLSDIAGMSAERIAEQDWPGQAQKLAPKESTPAESLDAKTPAENRQYDASFTLKLLLNEDHSVRRTQLVDNRSKAEEQWAGWNQHRMIEFISQQAALQLPAVEPTLPVAAPAKPEPAAAMMAEPVPAESAPPEPAPAAPALASFGGSLHLRELEPIPAGTTSLSRVFSQHLPFVVRLHLDLTGVELPNGDPLDYTAMVHAKRLGGGSREMVGQVHHTITPQDQLTILVPGKPLAPGTYRLDAMVTLSHPSAELDLSAYQEGGVLQVY
jgi:hypothetical protein